jgi:catechol 2,3-dioxygenase-like lactoylglutathione lyase family enzyme
VLARLVTLSVKPTSKEDDVNEETTTSRTPRITEVGMVGVPVTDQDRALEFYVGKLGFEKRVDVAHGDDARWVEVAPMGAATAIALVQSREGAPAGIETGIRLFVATVHSDAIEDTEAVHADLLARGVDTDQEVVHVEGIPPMFSVRDPDGNVLRVVAREHRV